MKWHTLGIREAEEQVNQWKTREDARPECPIEYSQLRRLLLEEHSRIISRIPERSVSGNEYKYDYHFGIYLYLILINESRFSMRIVADDGFWRFLSIKIIPDIIFDRWGINPERYWKNPRRMWLKTLWWYTHLSWQGDTAKTIDILAGNTTDQIVQLVERSGSSGYRVELSRCIMRQFQKEKTGLASGGTDLFRKVMKLNTARLKVFEPGLVTGGEEEYAKQLFKTIKIQR